MGEGLLGWSQGWVGARVALFAEGVAGIGVGKDRGLCLGALLECLDWGCPWGSSPGCSPLEVCLGGSGRALHQGPHSVCIHSMLSFIENLLCAVPGPGHCVWPSSVLR